MPTPQKAIFNEMGANQWYVHLSRVEGADLGVIKSVIAATRAAADEQGINLTVGIGPGLLPDLTDDVPDDFQDYVTVKSEDGSGREAKGTQEELLFWLNHNDKDKVWKVQYDARTALAGHMAVARETPTFIYGDSLDMTGFKDGTGNPADEDQPAVAIVPDGEPGAGGSHIIAQRWVHDLDGWNALSDDQQEKNFGRKKYPETDKTDSQEPYSHLSHVELRADGNHGNEGQRQDQRDRPALHAVRLPRRHRGAVLHGVLQGPGAAASPAAPDVRARRRERRARRDHRLLEPGLGLVLLRSQRGNPRRHLRLARTQPAQL